MYSGICPNRISMGPRKKSGIDRAPVYRELQHIAPWASCNDRNTDELFYYQPNKYILYSTVTQTRIQEHQTLREYSMLTYITNFDSIRLSCDLLYMSLEIN